MPHPGQRRRSEGTDWWWTVESRTGKIIKQSSRYSQRWRGIWREVGLSHTAQGLQVAQAGPEDPFL